MVWFNYLRLVPFLFEEQGEEKGRRVDDTEEREVSEEAIPKPVCWLWAVGQQL